MFFCLFLMDKNLISAFIILFFTCTERQQQKSKVAISVQHIWTEYSFLDYVQFTTWQFLPFSAHNTFILKYKVQLDKCTLHTNFNTKNKTYRRYLTSKSLALTHSHMHMFKGIRWCRKAHISWNKQSRLVHKWH
jgi:hypothetical protein